MNWRKAMAHSSNRKLTNISLDWMLLVSLNPFFVPGKVSCYGQKNKTKS